MLRPLKELQEEVAELKAANDDLIEKVSESEEREVKLELEKELLHRVKHLILNVQSLLFVLIC